MVMNVAVMLSNGGGFWDIFVGSTRLVTSPPSSHNSAPLIFPLWGGPLGTEKRRVEHEGKMSKKMVQRAAGWRGGGGRKHYTFEETPPHKLPLSASWRLFYASLNPSTLYAKGISHPLLLTLAMASLYGAALPLQRSCRHPFLLTTTPYQGNLWKYPSR